MKFFMQMRKQVLFVFITLLFSHVAIGNETAQQDITIRGTVTADTDGTGLPGVSVILKGTTRGTSTDANGAYVIAAPANGVLIFSFIGYQAQEIPVAGRTVIDLVMSEDVEMLGEVVVTALGITRQEKSLGYSVGKVSGSDMVKVPQENLLNALTGKISGVQISSTGGTGSSVSMVIRGASSLSSDNQPLFVIDGVPVSNTLNNISSFGSDNRVDYGNAISDLNAEDIESISVLKGPSAAALYGSRAGNGVVVVTTKSGKKNKGLRIDFSTNTVFDAPYRFFDVQKQFANGQQPYTPESFPDGHVMSVNPGIDYGSGIELDKGYYAIQWNSPLDANGQPVPTELVSHPNNMNHFVQTGITSTNSISVSNSTEKISYRFGLTNMSNRGIIPGSDLFRNNITAATSLNLAKNLVLSSNINYSQNWSNNRPAGNAGTNPLQWAYRVPNNTDIRELKSYWKPGREGYEVVVPHAVYENPYFLAHEVKNAFQRDRIFGNIMMEWEIIPKLSVMGRFAMDKSFERRETKIPLGYGKEINNGAYGLRNSTSYERNIDFLIKYTDRIGDFSFTVSAGGNEMYAKSSLMEAGSQPGMGLVVPGVFSLSNIEAGRLSYGSSWSQKAIQSVYAFANLGWKDMVYLDLTARNDWSSTLPKENRSYFYPSASLSLLVNQLIPLGRQVSLIKLRGGWAQVGNDTSPYQLLAVYSNYGQWGNALRMGESGTLLVPDLKPELATSKEIGMDLGFFDHRLRFEGTYFIVDNKNQIIRNVPDATSSGYNASNINMGLVQSRGWEFSIGMVPVKTNDWTLDINVNLTRVRTKIIELAPGIDKIEFWDDARAKSWAFVGQEIGDIYDNAIVTVTDPNSPYYGYPVIKNYELQYIPQEDALNKIGNYNPNFILGSQSSLRYKNFSLSWVIDWRCGGQFISQSERFMADDGYSLTRLKRLINPGDRSGKELRDWLVANEEKYIKNGFHTVGGPTRASGGFYESLSGIGVYDGCFIPGVYEIRDARGNFIGYGENLGEEGTQIFPYVMTHPWDFAKVDMFPSDYVKLREVSLTYQLPSKILERYKINGLAVSVYSRNIMLWTKANIGVDPERAFQIEGSTDGKRGTQFKQGIERWNLEPWAMPVGVKLNITF